MSSTTKHVSVRGRVSIAAVTLGVMATTGALAAIPAHADQKWHDGWCKKGEGFAVTVSLNKLPRPKYYVGAFAQIPADRNYIVRCVVGGVPGTGLGADAALRAAGFSVQGSASYIAGIEGVGDRSSGIPGVTVASGGWMRGQGSVPAEGGAGSWNGKFQISTFPIDGFQYFSAVGGATYPDVLPQFAADDGPTAPGTGPSGPATDPTAPGTGPSGPATDPTAPGTGPSGPATDPTDPGSNPPSQPPSDQPTPASQSQAPNDQQNPPADNQNPGQPGQQPSGQGNPAPEVPPLEAPLGSSTGSATGQSASALASASASATPTPTDTASPTAEATSTSTPTGDVVFGQDKPEQHSVATSSHGVPWPVWLVLGLLAAGALGWWFLVLAKRRRQDDDELQDEVQ